MICLSFKYKNCRNEDHEYVIQPDYAHGFTLMESDRSEAPKGIVNPEGLGERVIHLNGFLVTRDGDQRLELGADRKNRRRSFVLADMKDLSWCER